MYTLIKNVLRERYNTLDVVFQVPLGMIINNRNELSDKEKKFVLNPYTHIDFTIFNKRVVLAVEVDGYNYHVNNKKQVERDMMKNETLTRYNILLIRFKTNGSGEKEKLINKLEEVI